DGPAQKQNTVNQLLVLIYLYK
nr:RecName: Full=Hemocyanin subunit 4 [Maja squinado]